MARVYRRGNFWYVDIQRNKRRYRLKAGKTKRLAELFLKDLELKAERKQLGFLDRKEVDLDVFVNEFLTYSKANHRPTTTGRYGAALANFMRFIRQETKVTRLSDITPDTVEQYKIWRKNVVEVSGRNKPEQTKPQYLKQGAKNFTINFEITTLKTMLNFAVQLKRLETNPAREVKTLKTDDSKKRRFLTDVECTRLLEACPPDLHSIFFILINTGMRRGELLNLEWKDVDFHRYVIKIQRKPFWLPMTGEREIPMSKGVVEVLQNMPKRDSLIFTSKDGKPIAPNSLRLELAAIAKKAGVPDLTQVHALRHTFASRLFMKGVDAPTVQKLMGHTSIETTMIYTHQTQDHLRAAVEKLGR